LGAVITNPERYGLDFSFVAVFTALVFSFWKGRQDVLPWLVAAAVAAVSESLMPGKWYIVCGGVAGALVAALMPSKGASND
jgi:predicted branched-subunit amino acid permease